MSVQVSETSSSTAKTISQKDTRWRFSADKSANMASTVFVASGVLWLLVSTLLTLMAQFKLLNPGWLADWRWLTYGRIYPMAQNAFVYGWLSMAGMGILTWLWARLMQTKVKGALLLVSGAMLWNLGLTLGLIGLMTGFSRGIELLDMPLVAYVIMLFAVPPVLQSMYFTAKSCNVEKEYISAWYAAAAVIWLVLLLVSTLIPMQTGIASATFSAWFSHNMIGLWVLSIAIATGYYLIPKLTGKPVYSQHLAKFGFWTFALFMCWSSADQLIGSPIPQWLAILSIAFSFLMLIPVSVISVNLVLGLRKGSQKSSDPTTRFVFFAVVSFALYGLLDAIHPLRWWNEITQFTLSQSAHLQLGIYAFASMMAFGAIYFMMPRLTKRTWANPGMINFHYLLSAAGIVLLVVSYWLGGFFQGQALMDATVPMPETMSSFWLGIGILGTLSLTVGHLIFAYLFYGHLAQMQD